MVISFFWIFFILQATKLRREQFRVDNSFDNPTHTPMTLTKHKILDNYRLVLYSFRISTRQEYIDLLHWLDSKSLNFKSRNNGLLVKNETKRNVEENDERDVSQYHIKLTSYRALCREKRRSWHNVLFSRSAVEMMIYHLIILSLVAMLTASIPSNFLKSKIPQRQKCLHYS